MCLQINANVTLYLLGVQIGNFGNTLAISTILGHVKVVFTACGQKNLSINAALIVH